MWRSGIFIFIFIVTEGRDENALGIFFQKKGDRMPWEKCSFLPRRTAIKSTGDLRYEVDSSERKRVIG